MSIDWPNIAITIIVTIVTFLVVKLIETKLLIHKKRKEEIREIRRKKYEEFIETIEKILARKDNIPTKQFLDELNLIYAKMYISAPDEVIRTIKRQINDKFDAGKRKKIYLEIRKDLLGRTNVREDELCYFSEGKERPS